MDKPVLCKVCPTCHGTGYIKDDSNDDSKRSSPRRKGFNLILSKMWTEPTLPFPDFNDDTQDS